VRKDCIFNARITAAHFNPSDGKWTVQTENGITAVAKYFIPAIGSTAQQYVPDWKGLEDFQGTIHHTSIWPQEPVDVRGKRVAVIGTGSTGLQITQEWAKEATETFVFQRTPNLALPMRQQKLDERSQEQMRDETADLFDRSRKTSGGLPYESLAKTFAQFSSDEIAKILEGLYEGGGFRYWSGGYIDLLLNPEGNRAAYDYWAKRTRERIHDPVKRDLLAPLEPPHPFGTKRPSLEQDYYEQFNKPNVHLVNTKAHPIVQLTRQGIMTDDGKVYEVDIIALATGFDATTGGLAKMGIQDVNGVKLSERWRDGVLTFQGLMVPGFPNMFLPYSVHAPSPFSNGPVGIEFQADFIRDIVKKMKGEKIKSIDPSPEAAQAWKAEMEFIANMTLFPKTKSWYMGANIPGKKVELLYYFGGIPRYRDKCAEAFNRFSETFVVCQA
jgi:cation diffusion facilitator CzcD-associated flavoprotein CzcO